MLVKLIFSMLGLNVIGIQCANLLESFNIADICPWVYDYLGIPCGLHGWGSAYIHCRKRYFSSRSRKSEQTHGLLQKIQAIYFKICALYFEISALYFCAFQISETQQLTKLRKGLVKIWFSVVWQKPSAFCVFPYGWGAW